jgi:RNA polymerase sigma-70 factor (ECF subfamily)
LLHTALALPLSMADSESRPELAELHAAHADFVFRTLQRLGVRSMDLDDALQDVFLVVHRKLGGFDPSFNVRSWLFGIAVRVAVAHRRKAHLHRERSGTDFERTPRETSGGPEADAIEREGRERLAHILDKLTPEKRAVFVMFEIEGQTTVEIAEELGLPLGTVYSRLSSARAEFKQAVERLNRSQRSA